MSSKALPPLVSLSRKGSSTQGGQAGFPLPFWSIILIISSLISSCTVPESRSPLPPSPSSPSSHPSLSTVDRVLGAFSKHDFLTAKILIEKMPGSREKTLLKSILVDVRKNESLKGALSALSPSSPEKTLSERWERLYSLSPNSFLSVFLSLSGSSQVKIIHALVLNGQERLSIRTLRRVPHTSQRSGLIAFAYAQWAKRRETENRLFDARGLARQALQIDPQNLLARSIDMKIEKLRRQKISQGLLAYRHRHLHRAIQLWTEAQAIDPSQKEPKRYILKARAILEKIRSLTPSTK